MAFFRIKKFIRIYFLAFVSAMLLLSLTFITFFETYERVEGRNRTLFSVRAENAKNDIYKRLQDYIQVLKGAQGLIAVSDTISRQEWKTYVKTMEVDKNYPGILGIGYTVFLPDSRLASFQQQVREQGFPQFEVWPKSDRPYFTSILYLEPFNARNQRAFGFDMFTEPTRREAMRKARDTGEPALSGMVTLMQEGSTEVQKGILLYLPVYEGTEEPQSLEERRRKLRGFVYSPFRINDLMQGILGRRFADLDIQLYDSEKEIPETLLYDKGNLYNSGEIRPMSELQKEFTLQIAQHNWHLDIAAMPGFGYETAFPWLILIGGLLISGLFFMSMFSMANIRRGTYLREVITDNATAALLILDKKDYCTFMNPAAEILTGYTFEEISRQTLHSLVHHSHPDGSFYDPADCPIMKTLTGKQALINHEDVFFRRNGERIQVSINARPLYEKGRVDSYLMEVRNITQEKESEKALKEKNRNLEVLNKIGKTLSAELDQDKLLKTITDTCTEITGAEFGAFFYNGVNETEESFKLSTLSGPSRKIFSTFPMPGSAKVFAPTFEDKETIRSDDVTQDERYGLNTYFKGRYKKQLPVKSYLAVPVVSRQGHVIGGLFFGHPQPGKFSKSSEDIIRAIAAQSAIAIDNSQLFDDLNTKNTELQQINTELDNFVYSASHDLKAPVLNVEGLVYALKSALEGNKPERIPLMLNMMETSVLKFKDTIHALTEVARTNKNLDEEAAVIDVEEVLKDVCLSIHDLIQNSGARIVSDISCRHIRFPKANMTSVLQNLLVNAINYRSPDRLPLVSFSCRQQNGQLLIQVKDNGMGIPANQMSKIFIMFKRYHTHIEGSGVGLYLVKRIIENFGGTISVDSEIGQGTTFTISLPNSIGGESAS